jgi:hypothetical protein
MSGELFPHMDLVDGGGYNSVIITNEESAVNL